ncbi:MAG: rRNA pseudouridine synthase [Candidatus Omnitrophica bacterium]|nr:rRNA pseudouridine synthase [Candidatus Omnitrophota bacterium]MBU1996576.1 rRNA pseudouridine synthase [Candidatus Omnitrophota bacterium]MBU4334477.1 rRNA pseudouridine synthase [Candidatus Omnitrophota bacterium]
MRLQVFLSRNGVSSRRGALDLIKKGNVSLNGEVVFEPSTEVDEKCAGVSVNGERIKPRKFVYILLNKPKGYMTTKEDRFADKTVLDLLPKNLNHLAPVGRLDKDTEGLLLLTNDGDVAYKLTHPKFNIDKTYYVTLRERLEHQKRIKVENGVYLDGVKTLPAKIKIIKLLRDRTELTITIHEGKKRQVRRMFANVKTKVLYLKRLVQGPLKLGTLKVGCARELNAKEINSIRMIGDDV